MSIEPSACAYDNFCKLLHGTVCILSVLYHNKCIYCMITATFIFYFLCDYGHIYLLLPIVAKMPGPFE